jgi:hypothetical protein
MLPRSTEDDCGCSADDGGVQVVLIPRISDCSEHSRFEICSNVNH